MTMTSQVKAEINWVQRTALDLSTVQDASKLSCSTDLATGTAINLADLVWHDTRTVASGANDDLDLTAVARTIFGTSVPSPFVKVKSILIWNRSTATGEELVVDSSVANAFTGWCAGSITSKKQIGPNSPGLFANNCDGWAVTGGTGDILRITNTGAAPIIYDIVIIGTSA